MTMTDRHVILFPVKKQSLFLGSYLDIDLYYIKNEKLRHNPVELLVFLCSLSIRLDRVARVSSEVLQKKMLD